MGAVKRKSRHQKSNQELHNSASKKKKLQNNSSDKTFTKRKSTFTSRSNSSTVCNPKKKHKHESVKATAFNEDLPEDRTNDFAMRYLIVKPGAKWFDQLPSEPEKGTIPKPDVIAQLQTEAQSYLNQDNASYQKFLGKRKEKSDFSWMMTILHSGTLNDKISAHTLLIQDSPVHNLRSLEALVGMVNPKGKRECIMALDSLKDLFCSDLLRKNKKLRLFDKHPLGNLDEMTSENIQSRKKILVLWYFEHQLKSVYEKFLKSLDVVSRDNVEKTKQKSVTAMYELLKDNCEQEQFLLEHLVNKIGDPVPKIGSLASYLLGQLVYCHPNMISIIVKEVERLLFRPNVAERAKYYCLCCLNQLILCHEQYNIANHLIMMYFGLFRMCIKKGEVDTKMMSALLTGVSRAYPYSKLKSDVLMEQLDAMFQLVHMVSFNISVQTLMLIFQVLDSKDNLSDRFYSALYRKILDPALGTSTRQSMLLNLLYKALKKDVAQVRVRSFVKRLVQVALYQSSSFQCGILMLISELAKTHTDLLVTQQLVASDSDSEEHYEDICDEGEVEELIKEKEASSNACASTSWVHRSAKKDKKSGYDPLFRNPLYSGSQYSNLWELHFLKNNFHPTVALFTHQVSNSIDINYEGDPLHDFTIIRYLDRFVYKNPKQQFKSGKADVHRKLFGKRLKPASELAQIPVTSNSYTDQREDKIPVEERFIYKYLKQRSAKKKRDDSDAESVNSDEFDEFLDRIHAEDEGKGAIDFERELSASHKKNSIKKKNDQEIESDLESFKSESDSEFDIDFDNDPEFQDEFKEFDEDFEGLNDPEIKGDSENSNEDSEMNFPTKWKTVVKSKKNVRGDKDMFASADEFSMLLEDNAAVDATSSEAFINTDKAAAKQLSWEKQRHQFVKGTDWRSRKSKKKSPRRSKK